LNNSFPYEEVAES